MKGDADFVAAFGLPHGDPCFQLGQLHFAFVQAFRPGLFVTVLALRHGKLGVALPDASDAAGGFRASDGGQQFFLLLLRAVCEGDDLQRRHIAGGVFGVDRHQTAGQGIGGGAKLVVIFGIGDKVGHVICADVLQVFFTGSGVGLFGILRVASLLFQQLTGQLLRRVAIGRGQTHHGQIRDVLVPVPVGGQLGGFEQIFQVMLAHARLGDALLTLDVLDVGDKNVIPVLCHFVGPVVEAFAGQLRRRRDPDFTGTPGCFFGIFLRHAIFLLG